MQRRGFLAAAGAAGLAPWAAAATAAEARGARKQLYELRLYQLASAEKQKAWDDFLRDAAVGAWNRLGIQPVGVFRMAEGDSPNLYVLLPHAALGSMMTAQTRLLADAEFQKAGAAVLDGPMSDPAYLRMESWLLLAFDRVPKVETPTSKDTRVFQLRIYESHNGKKAKKKVEMFNEGGEIDLFRRLGMAPVFFGETLIGSNMPNLTYMLGFDDKEAL